MINLGYGEEGDEEKLKQEKLDEKEKLLKKEVEEKKETKETKEKDTPKCPIDHTKMKKEKKFPGHGPNEDGFIHKLYEKDEKTVAESE